MKIIKANTEFRITPLYTITLAVQPCRYHFKKIYAQLMTTQNL